MVKSAILRVAILVSAVVGGVLLSAVWWLDSQFEEPGTPRVSSVAEHVDAGSVLAVFAHPDDEISSTGLLLRAHARDGAVTRMITATRGDAGTPYPQVSRLEDMATIRHAEVLKNGYAIGLSQQDVWDYPDGGLSDVDFDELVERIMARMREWQPDLIVTFWPESGYSYHPDHMTAGRAATEAVRRLRDTDPDNAPRAIAYVLAPRRMMERFGGETGALIVANQPDPDVYMPGEGRAKIRGWEIHASQSEYLQHAYGFPASVVHTLFDKEFYHLVVLDTAEQV